MSITDEFREWLDRRVFKGESHEQLTAIADRIDAAMEDYIELPVDADGVPIRIGDILDPPTDCPDYSPLQVMRLTFDGYEDEWFFDGEAGGFTGMTGVHMDVAGWTHHHIQPDSWERIITDALNAEWGEGKVPNLVERCKRLAGEGA